MEDREYLVLDRLIAVSEEGQLFTILIVQEYVLTPNNGGIERKKGLKTARTPDGKHCRMIDEDTFEIVELGLVVAKV